MKEREEKKAKQKNGRMGLPGEGEDLEDDLSADEEKGQTVTVREEQTTEQFSISNAVVMMMKTITEMKTFLELILIHISSY